MNVPCLLGWLNGAVVLLTRGLGSVSSPEKMELCYPEVIIRLGSRIDATGPSCCGHPERLCVSPE